MDNIWVMYCVPGAVLSVSMNHAESSQQPIIFNYNYLHFNDENTDTLRS